MVDYNNSNPEVYAKIKEVSLNDSGDFLTIRGLANTTRRDRVGDIIPVEAWRSENALTNYMKNPIVLAFHDHTLPIGTVVELNITTEGLEVVARIFKSAGRIFDIIKDGILKTFSIGFRALDAQYDEASNSFLITDIELLEISVVSVPCNQDSVFSLEKSMNAKDFSLLKERFKNKNAIEKTEVEKLLELMAARS
jgi:HK97 family phage prohead protease